MFAEGDCAIFPDLYVPGKTVSVRVYGGNDVVESISVDVVDQYLGCGVGKVEGVLGPHRIVCPRSRLLPPAIFFKYVNMPIAIDVSTADAVGEPLVITLGANGMEFPRRGRIFP